MTIPDANSQRTTIHEAPTLDRLAPDLVWKILEYVPKSLSDLRMTSHVLRDRVDEHAFHRLSTQIVDKVEIGQVNYNFTEIWITTARCNAKAFNSRLVGTISMNLLEICKRSKFNHTYTFKMTLDSRVYYGNVLELLGKCIGKRIGKAVLFNCNTYANVLVASKVLEGMQFKLLDVTTNTFSNFAIKRLLNAITSHKVDRITLNVREFETANPVDLLLELASRIKSIDIYQPVISGSSRGCANFMFGVANANWAAIIVEMFTRKLDKLVIHNTYYPEYLSAKCVQHLVVQLPLLGKKLYLKADCSKLAENRDFTSNEHLVRVDHTSLCALSIIHSSRKNETTK